MKKTLCLLLLVLFCLLPVGCAKSPDAPIGFEVLPETVTPTGLTYRITRGAENWGFGDDYALEKQENGEWVAVPIVESDIELAFNAIEHVLDPGQQKDMTANWLLLYGELADGHYRMVKTFDNEENGSHDRITLYAEFDIRS